MKEVTRTTWKTWPRIWPFVLLAFILLNYSNCSSTKLEDKPSAKMSSSTLELGSICTQTEEDIFAQGYHQFFKTTCNNCHVSGPGKGTFAHPTVATAFSSFQAMGYEKLSAMAVSDSHNYPYTGSHNIERISALKDQWRTFLVEKQKCGGTSTTTTAAAATFTPKFITIKKPVPEVKGTPKTVNINGTNTPIVEYNVVSVTYNLDGDLSPLGDTPVPNTGGATLTISISGFSTPSGSTGYLIQMPKLKTGTQSLKFDGMHIQLNGQPIRYTYTFQHIQKTLYKGTEALLSGGSMLVLGPLLTTDQIAVTIGTLDVVDIAAPPAPPKVQFAAAAATILKSDLGPTTPYKVAVSVLGDNSNPITVGLTTVGDEKQVGIAKGVIGAGGKNRFDWDYKIISPMSITFLPGETTKYIDIVFSDDERDDVDKALTLKLADPFGADLGTNSTIVISLPDYNLAPTGTAPTFAQLMSPGGILEMNCVRCHNSIEKQGGYDMTDYNMMVSKGIIVPGDLTPNNHKMFRRMNPDAPGAGTITSMPLDGFLTQDLTIFVEDWIKAGAKNN